MKSDALLKRAADVLLIEANGILAIIDRLDQNFVHAVELMRACRGKIVVTGLGKSGLICQKIAATLASTGTPSFFLHAGDAVHGDLGMVREDDLILAVSNSGEADEILKLLPHFKHHAIRLLVITGNLNSTLAKAGDAVLDVRVTAEASSLGPAPTASTTAALAMGDALAVVLLEEKGFKDEDFALRHPGGTLGRRLLLRVADLMSQGEQLPMVQDQTLVRDALFEITSKRLGVTGVTDGDGKLVGIITDGDLRRGLERKGQILQLAAAEIMTRKPKTIPADTMATEAMAVMERFSITALFVTDTSDRPVGVIHLHDLVKAGI
jgi:arabinose-5-phosphate isomerase